MTEIEVQGKVPASWGILGSSSAGLGQFRSCAAALPDEPQSRQLITCPECGSTELRKSGKAKLSDNSEIQRLKCLDCGFRFRENYVALGKSLKAQGHNTTNRQVCVQSVRGTKNLDPAAAERIETTAGVTQPLSDDKSELLAYTWKMQKEGYSYETVRLNTGALRALLKRDAILADPENVKEVLAKEQSWSSSRRRNVINAYTLFLKFHGLKWEKPRCKVTKKIPFIPTEHEIDDLIAGCPTVISVFLQLLKETAMRSGEAKRLKWVDVDLERRIITLNDPEKGSLPRIFNALSSKLLGMLNSLPRTSEHVFGERSLNSFKAVYQRSRAKVAFKLSNPRLLEVHFHTLRHWKATMEYHYTKDILHVMQFLGHKEIDNTLIYISLDKNLFSNLPDDCFTMRVVKTPEEAIELGKLGFEPFDVVDGVKIYRKRK